MSNDVPLIEATVKADFFSVFLEEQMSSSLRSCLEFCVDTFANKYFDSPLLQSKRALITSILDSSINFAFLTAYDALFSEFFYKLKRVPKGSSPEPKKLPKRTKTVIIVCYLLKNHIIEKLQIWLSRRNQQETQQPNSSQSFIIRTLLKVGALLLTLIKLVQFGFKIR